MLSKNPYSKLCFRLQQTYCQDFIKIRVQISLKIVVVSPLGDSFLVWVILEKKVCIFCQFCLRGLFWKQKTI